MSKERDLCRAVAMASDQIDLLRRAILEFKQAPNLSFVDRELLFDAEEYLNDMQNSEQHYRGLLKDLSDLSGIEISAIGYDED